MTLIEIRSAAGFLRVNFYCTLLYKFAFRYCNKSSTKKNEKIRKIVFLRKKKALLFVLSRKHCKTQTLWL